MLCLKWHTVFRIQGRICLKLITADCSTAPDKILTLCVGQRGGFNLREGSFPGENLSVPYLHRKFNQFWKVQLKGEICRLKPNCWVKLVQPTKQPTNSNEGNLKCPLWFELAVLARQLGSPQTETSLNNLIQVSWNKMKIAVSQTYGLSKV